MLSLRAAGTELVASLDILGKVQAKRLLHSPLESSGDFAFAFKKGPAEPLLPVLQTMTVAELPAVPGDPYTRALSLTSSQQVPPSKSTRNLIHRVVSQPVVIKGYLQKQSTGGLSSWQRRYFALTSTHFSYWKKKPASLGDAAKAAVPTSEILRVCARAKLLIGPPLRLVLQLDESKASSGQFGLEFGMMAFVNCCSL